MESGIRCAVVALKVRADVEGALNQHAVCVPSVRGIACEHTLEMILSRSVANIALKDSEICPIMRETAEARTNSEL